MNIKEIKRLDNKELKTFNSKHLTTKFISMGNTKILDGYKKDHLDHLIISLGDNKVTKTPYIDIRVWTKDRHTGKQIPTKKGVRFSPSEYAALHNMMDDNLDLITNSKENQNLTPTAGHLQEEILDEVDSNEDD